MNLKDVVEYRIRNKEVDERNVSCENEARTSRGPRSHGLSIKTDIVFRRCFEHVGMVDVESRTSFVHLNSPRLTSTP